VRRRHCARASSRRSSHTGRPAGQRQCDAVWARRQPVITAISCFPHSCSPDSACAGS
jgi:hypothetical protein